MSPVPMLAWSNRPIPILHLDCWSAGVVLEHTDQSRVVLSNELGGHEPRAPDFCHTQLCFSMTQWQVVCQSVSLSITRCVKTNDHRITQFAAQSGIQGNLVCGCQLLYPKSTRIIILIRKSWTYKPRSIVISLILCHFIDNDFCLNDLSLPTRSLPVAKRVHCTVFMSDYSSISHESDTTAHNWWQVTSRRTSMSMSIIDLYSTESWSIFTALSISTAHRWMKNVLENVLQWWKHFWPRRLEILLETCF